MTTPVAEVIKRHFPQSIIAFLVEKPFAPLLEKNPFIDEILIYDKTRVTDIWQRVRARHFDWVLDFMSSPRSAMVTLLSGAKVRAGYRVPFWGMVYTQRVKRPGAGLSVIEGKMTLLKPLIGDLGVIPQRKIVLTQEEEIAAKAWLGSDAPPCDRNGPDASAWHSQMEGCVFCRSR